MKTKSPIKLKKYEYNDKFKNIVIKNNTAIINNQEPLTFTPASSLEDQMVTIESLKMVTPHQLVTLKATVKNLSAQKTIKMDKGTLSKSSGTLVDPTGSTSAVVWEEWVNCVQINTTTSSPT